MIEVTTSVEAYDVPAKSHNPLTGPQKVDHLRKLVILLTPLIPVTNCYRYHVIGNTHCNPVAQRAADVPHN